MGLGAAFTKEAVTGAAATSTMHTPTTSPFLMGEFPTRKSPWEEDTANTTPMFDAVACVATHQSTTYLPASLNVSSPVPLL